MGFAAFSIEAFAQHLHELGIQPGMPIVVHASLLSFGNLEGRAAGVLSTLTSILGPSAEIAVPTFTFDLDPNVPFDPAHVPPRGMGALSELVRSLPEARRSPSCIHSYAGIGGVASLLPRLRHDCSYGQGSFFDLALRHNFYWVMLGCSVNEGCTLLHHSEAEVGVPYREWLLLDRKLRNPDGSVLKFKYHYYARKTDAVAHNFNIVTQQLIARGKMRKVRAPHGVSHAGWSRDIHEMGCALLQKDPRALIETEAFRNASW